MWTESRNYRFYLIFVFVACFVFSGAILFFGGKEIRQTIKYNIKSSVMPKLVYSAHSAEKNSPYSVREGNIIRIKPYDVTFEIPSKWLTYYREKNLYLSYEELNYLPLHNGSDEEDAEVIDSVLSFDDCAANVGNKGWGNYLWNDLQGRVYFVDSSPEQITERIEKQGLGKAKEVFERAELHYRKLERWQKITVEVLDAPEWSDFMLGKVFDFYFTSFENKTVVFVFLHTDRFENEINLILNTFNCSSETENSPMIKPLPKRRNKTYSAQTSSNNQNSN